MDVVSYARVGTVIPLTVTVAAVTFEVIPVGWDTVYRSAWVPVSATPATVTCLEEPIDFVANCADIDEVSMETVSPDTTPTSDAAVNDYCRLFSTLGDLYPGVGEAQQGAILIDAHLAANAIGANPLMAGVPLGRGKEGARRLELAREQAPYADFFIADPDYTLVAVSERR